MLRSDPPLPAAAVADAQAAADRAAESSGVRVEVVSARRDLDVARDLVDAIWRPDATDPPMTQGVLRALTHGGNYCAIARDGDRPVGVCIAFLGLVPRHSLYSHIAGVLPDTAGRHVGRAMKLHQRAWALAHGLREVLWTFDPLVRRNAFFNLAKLGARPSAYLIDFYGPMRDSINVGQPTDRCEVTWRLLDDVVVAAAAGRTSEPDVARLLQRGADLLVADVDGEPVTREGGDGPVALVQVPADIEGVRSTDGARAARWRAQTRAALSPRLAAGWSVSGFSRDGYFVLERD